MFSDNLYIEKSLDETSKPGINFRNKIFTNVSGVAGGLATCLIINGGAAG
jgi:hypothetical protein